uniref:Uncharacterized protein n=1 Tax=Nelumbo nucifera TaxID=4432 RepID=A0A822YRK9_NELNU|nr:TPA_asm: hypothetical protein HUJ06_012267 [Nelumbo nucifera]
MGKANRKKQEAEIVKTAYQNYWNVDWTTVVSDLLSPEGKKEIGRNRKPKPSGLPGLQRLERRRECRCSATTSRLGGYRALEQIKTK